MSVEEMKLLAIHEIYSLSDELAVKEILEHLVQLKNTNESLNDADAFFKNASEKYGDVLQKLAQ